MSVIPSQLPGGDGKSSVSIFGRRVSTDALLLAGASVVAIVLLYRAQRSGGVSGAPAPLSLSGDGSSLAGLPGNPLISSAPPPAAGPSVGPGQIEVTGSPVDPRGTAVWSFDPKHIGILGWLAPDQIVNFTGFATGFSGDPGYLLNYGGQTGFVGGQYVIGIGNPAPPPAPAPAPAGAWTPGPQSFMVQGSGPADRPR